MKFTIPVFIILLFIFSCGNSEQNSTLSDAKKVQAQLTEMRPGGIPTEEGGWTMTAIIDGKKWTASNIMSPQAAGRISGDNKGVSIGLPYDRRYMVVGEKIAFGENNAVDLFTNDEVGIWGGRKGEMEITKVDDSWAEGTFYFTATGDPDKTIEIKDGFFRISMKEPQK